MQTDKITAADITGLLAAKHQKDIFIPQCKTGSTWMGAPHILDAWVMPRSWTKPVIGYEIKVSRSDYQRDKKWKIYLEYCHLFYFVVPYGLIEPREVAEPSRWATIKSLCRSCHALRARAGSTTGHTE